MADRWIITSYDFLEHKTLGAAEAERDRLMKAFPDKKFRVRRLKTGLKSDGSYVRMAAALIDALGCGLFSPAMSGQWRRKHAEIISEIAKIEDHPLGRTAIPVGEEKTPEEIATERLRALENRQTNPPDDTISSSTGRTRIVHVNPTRYWNEKTVIEIPAGLRICDLADILSAIRRHLHPTDQDRVAVRIETVGIGAALFDALRYLKIPVIERHPLRNRPEAIE